MSSPHSDTQSDDNKCPAPQHTHGRKKGKPLENTFKLSLDSQ